MTIAATVTPTLKRQYPHVDGIEDWRAQQSVHLLWDRVFDLEARLRAAEGTITTLLAQANTQATSLAAVTTAANEALAIAQGVAGAGGTSGGGALPGGGDGGAGAEGLAAAGPTGHDSGGLLTAIRAGQIVGGTGNEWIALRNPTATLAERLTNREELMQRIVWHLRLAGFSAGRQRNPSGIISPNKLTVVVDGVLRAYDVLLASGDHTIQMGMSMDEVTPPVMVDDAGTPD